MEVLDEDPDAYVRDRSAEQAKAQLSTVTVGNRVGNVTPCWIEGCATKPCFRNTVVGADVLLAHINALHAGAYPLTCATCGKGGFQSFQDMNRTAPHSVACESAREGKLAAKLGREVICGICSQLCTSRNRFFRHLNEHHGAKFPAPVTLVCPTCSKSGFMSASALDAHITKAHPAPL